jgi:methylaspartate ammonia-lyase
MSGKATQKQIDYINTLINRKYPDKTQHPQIIIDVLGQAAKIVDMTPGQASKLIKALVDK